MDLILKYFPHLSLQQKEQFAALGELYREWNAKINVISRRDMGSASDKGSAEDSGTEGLYLRHVLHSLAIARICDFGEGGSDPDPGLCPDAATRVLDIGTGGGFPAIPLAIFFPSAHFTAVDSIGKKIRVVEEIARGIGISNVEAVNARVETIPGKFDYVVSRAVAPAATLMNWAWGKIERGQAGSLPNGMLLLKGGDLAAELAEAGMHKAGTGLHKAAPSETRGLGDTKITAEPTGAKPSYTEYYIADLFGEEFFKTKKIIYIGK